jgi:putative protease
VYFEPDFPISKTSSCCNRSPYEGAAEQIQKAADLCRAHAVPLVWKFPRINRTAWSDTVLPLVPQIATTGIAGIMVENPGMLYALLTLISPSSLSGSSGLNVFNHATAKKLSSSCHLLTLSPELSRDECRVLVSAARKQGLTTSFALIVEGNIEAVISDDCLLEPRLHCRGDRDKQGEMFFGIRDSTGHVFPVRIDSECRTHIRNSSELCLVDHLPEIMDMGISEVVVDVRGRTGSYVSAVTRIYRTALSATATRAADREKQLAALKEQIKRISSGEITAGHFLRGLKES